jgi:quercetin dioxygenase-like cupin family protein
MGADEKHDLGVPEDLEALIDYQPASVVSRTLIKKPSGTVTLFAFDAGEGLSEHTAPYDARIVLMDGEAEVQIAQETHVVKKGQTLLLPANVPHALRATSKFKMMLTMIRS